MIIERQEDVTRAVLKELERAPNARFREIMGAFVHHMHDFVRESKITEEEARQYYNLHKEDFAQPATVTLREILRRLSSTYCRFIGEHATLIYRVPPSTGGKTSVENLMPACKRHANSRGSRPWDAIMTRIECSP